MPFFHFLVFLLCPGCEKLLTASQSKDNTKSYPHYHCTVRCSCRFMVELFNGVFVDELKKYVPRPEVDDAPVGDLDRPPWRVSCRDVALAVSVPVSLQL